MSLYGGYFAEGFGLDPYGLATKEDCEYYKERHVYWESARKLVGNYAYKVNEDMKALENRFPSNINPYRWDNEDPNREVPEGHATMIYPESFTVTSVNGRNRALFALKQLLDMLVEQVYQARRMQSFYAYLIHRDCECENWEFQPWGGGITRPDQPYDDDEIDEIIDRIEYPSFHLNN